MDLYLNTQISHTFEYALCCIAIFVRKKLRETNLNYKRTLCVSMLELLSTT